MTIMIEGPTASGKTDISANIAGSVNAEIISCDSRAFYREMKIGTARPEKVHLGIKHHFVAFLDLDDEMNVADYVKAANESIDSIHDRGKNVIITGGSPLYARGLINGISDKIPKGNYVIRDKYKKLADKYGNNFVHGILKKIDPKRAEFLHPNDSRRVIRSLEVYRIDKKKLSGLVDQKFFYSESNISGRNIDKYLLNIERSVLYERINKRVDQMLKKGLFREVQLLVDKYGIDNKILNSTIGYQEVIRYFKGDMEEAEAIEKIKINSRRLAKRQLTWYKREKADCYECADMNTAIEMIKKDLNLKYF